jgi:hypothetical protein
MTNTTSGLSSATIQEAIYGKQTDIAAARTTPRVVDPQAVANGSQPAEPVVAEASPDKAKASGVESWVTQEIANFHHDLLKTAHNIIALGRSGFAASTTTVEEVIAGAEKLAAHIESKVEAAVKKLF